MSQYFQQSFFFQQKKRPLLKRIRKPIDLQSLYGGDKREPVLTFRPQRSEIGDTVLKSPRHRRPLSSVSRQSSVHLPPVDTSGPRLTTNQLNPELTDKRQSVVFQSLDQPPPPEEVTNPSSSQLKYKFNELKIASTGILSKLSKRFEPSFNEISLPEGLASVLSWNYHQLVSDVIVEKREWQTDCYLDYNKSRWSKTGEKSDHSKKEAATRRKNMTEKEIERPFTAKSTASGISIRSDMSHDSSHDAEYDKLPPELRTQGPQPFRYRRETQAPKRKVSGPKTRLEKFKAMKSEAEKERQKRIDIKKGKTHPLSRLGSIANKDETEGSTTTRVGAINFSLSSKACADQGWIVHPSQTKDPEGYTLHQWANGRLQESIRRREETLLTAKLRGEDGPLVICHYKDSHARSLRGGKHQRSSTVPLPTVFSKLPPSLATFSTPGQNDSLLSNEGVAICLLQLPDGSGFCRYYSGRIAISMSRKGDGSRGLYTIVYDDTESNNVIGYFMPDGQSACYHRNGSLHMMADSDGGLLLDDEGFEIRKWTWPPVSERMSQIIRIQLNTHIAVQCTGKTQIVLKFSCHGQMCKFPVGTVPELIGSQDTKNESFWMKRTDIISDTLQTSYNFQSKAAKSSTDEGAMMGDDSLLSSQPHSREMARSNQMRQGGGSVDMLGESLLNVSIKEKFEIDLEDYRNKVNYLVNEWLNNYRQYIGIAPPSLQGPTGLNSSGGSCHRLISSTGLRSRQGSRPFILPTSRPTSRLLTHTPPTRSVSPNSDLGASSFANFTPQPELTSPLNELIERPKSQEQPRPFKAGSAKPRQRPLVSFKTGCPIALHEMLVEKLVAMPKCKCDRRHLPIIRDLEYDLFFKFHIPRAQLVIVYITNSSLSHESTCQPLLESINYSSNTNRYSPCQQCGNDLFRILKYDIVHSCDDINSPHSLLVERHHVFPEMFLIYMGSHLLAGITGFNGYGITRRDFMKQIQRSLESGRDGHFLPSDFKFSNSTIAGNKIHSSSLWAYPVSGVLDELISQTPSNQSLSSKMSKDYMLGKPLTQTSKIIYKRDLN